MQSNNTQTHLGDQFCTTVLMWTHSAHFEYMHTYCFSFDGKWKWARFNTLNVGMIFSNWLSAQINFIEVFSIDWRCIFRKLSVIRWSQKTKCDFKWSTLTPIKLCSMRAWSWKILPFIYGWYKLWSCNVTTQQQNMIRLVGSRFPFGVCAIITISLTGQQ